VLKSYRLENGNLLEFEGPLDAAGLHRAQWINLCDGTPEEKALVEGALKIDVSPVNDYEPFQVSSHFSVSPHQMTMTALLLTLRDGNDPQLLKLTFIRARSVLVTISDGEPIGLGALIKECEGSFSRGSGPDDVLAGIFGMIVDHTDNILDKAAHDLERINTMVFQHRASAKRRLVLEAAPRRRNRQLERVLSDLGPSREILVKLRRSVLSF
jgi:Mg2+ and Co2+ transporter CorA